MYQTHRVARVYKVHTVLVILRAPWASNIDVSTFWNVVIMNICGRIKEYEYTRAFQVVHTFRQRMSEVPSRGLLPTRPGLFARGLGTRLITNAIQASMFTVVWKYLEMNMNA